MATIYKELVKGNTVYCGASGPGVAIGEIPRKDILEVWFDPSNSTLVTLNGSDVATLIDKTANGNDVAQSTAGQQPALTAAAIGGLSAMTFVSADSNLLTRANQTLAGESGEIWIIVNIVSFGGVEISSCSSASDLPDVSMLAANFDAGANPAFANYAFDASATLGYVREDTDVSTGTDYLIRRGSNGTTYFMDLNGVAQTVSQVVAPGDTGVWFADVPSRNNFSLGGAKRTTEVNFSNRILGEIMIWDGGTLTAAEAAQITTYLSRKWSI